jgi:nucleoside-diphosphate-sugar epimerase
MNILITGATGYIGSFLIQKLQSLGHNIICVNRSNKLSAHGTSVNYNGSYDSLASAFVENNIEAVFHLATLFTSKHSPNQIDDIVRSNILFGTHLLEAMSQYNVKYLVNASTYATELPEDKSPQNLYAATKKAFEAILDFYTANSNIAAITLSLTDTYGPQDNRPKFLNLALRAFTEKKDFKMSEGKQEVSLLYIDDAVDAFLVCCELLKSLHKGHHHYSVCGPEILTLEKLIDVIAEVVGFATFVQKGYYPYRAREIMQWRPLYPILPDWQPKISLKQGIKRTLKDLNEGVAYEVPGN